MRMMHERPGYASRDHARFRTAGAEFSTGVENFPQHHPSDSFRLIQTYKTGDGTAAGTRYFIMSGTLSPERLLTAVRAHWRIENSLHWVLDVAMNEDGQRNRTGNGPQNLAMMRRMALNLVRSAEERKGVSMRGRMKMAGWDHDVLLELVRAAARLSEEARKMEVQKR